MEFQGLKQPKYPQEYIKSRITSSNVKDSNKSISLKIFRIISGKKAGNQIEYLQLGIKQLLQDQYNSPTTEIIVHCLITVFN